MDTITTCKTGSVSIIVDKCEGVILLKKWIAKTLFMEILKHYM